MKEIISAVLLIVSIYCGTVVLKNINDSIKQAALEKAAKGLPSLVKINESIRRTKNK